MTAPFAPVTATEAARNAALLASEVRAYDLARSGPRAPRHQVRDTSGRFMPAAGYPGRAPRAARRESARRAARGLTPAARARLMAAAKARALDFAAAVRSGNAQAVQRLSASMSPDAWRALAIVLAEAADPARLLAVTHVPDDGLPAHLSPEGRTRAA
jgi:hypothetical protein